MKWIEETRLKLNSNIMLLIRTKRNQIIRNQPKLQTLLKANDEIKTEHKTNEKKTSFSAGALCN